MKNIILILFLVFAFSLSQLHAQISSAKASTKNGILEGHIENGIAIFCGVAYAQPPVKALRWKAPIPVKNWKGVKKATSFGSRAMQNKIYDDIIFRSDHISEDCLYLNIWAPAKYKDMRLPVLVYFHGGGFAAGDGSEPRYDGESMAKNGIIMITVNYRMGIFGFFSHPGLTSESKYHASGNYGLLDQNASLKWIKENISAFGGDPNLITIAGQSAGSTSVSLQMASPLSKGLFRAAIGQSGSVLNMNPPPTLKASEEIGLNFMKAEGMKSIEELRKLTAHDLLKRSTDRNAYFPINIDGYFLPDLPINIYTTGKQADVALLAGWTSAEVSNKLILGNDVPTMDNYQKALSRLFGKDAEEIRKFYPALSDEEVPFISTILASDRFAGYSTWKWIDLHGKTNGKRVYRYLFQQLLPQEKGDRSNGKKIFGAPHSADIPYALGNLSKDKAHKYQDEDYQTSKLMQGFFVNFVKTGDPNGAGLPKWSGFQASIPQVMMIGGETKQEPEKFLKRFQFLDQIYYK